MSDQEPTRRTFAYRFPAIPEKPTGWRKELVQILEGNSAVIPTEGEIDGLFACLENFIQEEFVVAKWSYIPPRHAGVYWYQESASEPPVTAEVKLLTFPDEGVGRWFAYSCAWDSGQQLKDLRGRWSGPLSSPNPFEDWPTSASGTRGPMFVPPREGGW